LWKVGKSMDGIVVSHEEIHSLKMTKKDGMMMKLDMSKAYDRMNWNFLRNILLDLFFGGEWVEWVLNLVYSCLLFYPCEWISFETFNPYQGDLR
jgi:hypothetical protein